MLRMSIWITFLFFGLVKAKLSHNVLSFGAKGDGQTDDSMAFVKTWNATCHGERDNTTLLIPAGKTFLLQPVMFQGPCKSTSITFKLAGDIVAPENKGEWLSYKFEGWIRFSNVPGLTIVGSGTINGRGSSFWEPRMEVSARPTALHIYKCDNLKINGITSIDSPRNHISIKRSNTVSVSNVKLFAPEKSPNTDGFDIMDSTNVHVSDSTIYTGDDCIEINTGVVNIEITGINCGLGHGISVGSLGGNGIEAAVSDVLVSHCTFNKTQNGARIKTWPGGKGYARNISFEDITVIDACNPIIINQQYMDRNRKHLKGSAVAISDIKFVNFRGTTARENAITLKCSASTPCENIVMNGIEIITTDGKQPIVDCENVDGNSNDINMMRSCFNKATISSS